MCLSVLLLELALRLASFSTTRCIHGPTMLRYTSSAAFTAWGLPWEKCIKATEISFLWFSSSFSFKGYFWAACSPQASAQDLVSTPVVSTYQHLGRWDIISSSATLLAHPSSWRATTEGGLSLSLLLPRTSRPQSCFKPGYLEAEVTESTLLKTLGMCVYMRERERARWGVLVFRGIIFGLTAPHTHFDGSHCPGGGKLAHWHVVQHMCD